MHKQNAPPEQRDDNSPRHGRACFAEITGIFVLLGLVVFFLATSWRKWPDPIVDFGQQCYSFWRLSEGAVPYHDFQWNYGPFSLFLNAALFKWFDPGIMVLVWANLAVYFLILALAYAAFRMAWGWRGAFAACVTFISVFSFSHLLGVGNYNYATPYAGEAVHGMALMFLGAFILCKWTCSPSLKLAFLLGLVGGMAAVIKPEFMLAMGVTGIAAVALRFMSGARPKLAELGVMFAGLVIPTLFFTLLLSRSVPLKTAFVDASSAWWLVLVEHVQSGDVQQQTFSGTSNPVFNLLHELVWTGSVMFTVGAVALCSWSLDRPWPLWKRLILIVGVVALAWECRMREGWFFIGRSLPGLTAIAFLVVLFSLRKSISTNRKVDTTSCMKLMLIVLGGTMLIRMALSARVYHLGFFQAAIAGMVVAAMLIAETPKIFQEGKSGKCLACFGCWALLIYGCATIASISLRIRADQVEPVGQTQDRFYSTTRSIDGTGALVNWAAEKISALPPDARVLVLPEGTMINYLARRKGVDPGWTRGMPESQFIESLKSSPPEYIIFITRDTSDFGVKRFGAEGNVGHDLVKWVAQNYAIESGVGGDPLALNDHPGALIMRLKK